MMKTEDFCMSDWRDYLPSEWSERPLGDLVTSLETGVSVRGESRPAGEGEVGVLKVSAVSEGVFRPEEHKAVIPQDRGRVQVKPRAGSVIVSRANTASLVGASALVTENYENLYLPDKLWQLQLGDDDEAANWWFSHLVQSDIVRAAFHGIATGTSAGMKNISQTDALRVPIPTPPVRERAAIGKTFQIWDRAIDRLDALVAALERRQRGLMQRLLSVEERFPEFEGDPDWQPVPFGKLFRVASKKEAQIQKSEYAEEGAHPVVDQGQDLVVARTNHLPTVDALPVVVFGDHTREIKWIDFPFVIGADGTKLFYAQPGVDLRFAYHLLLNTPISNLGYSRHMKRLKSKRFLLPPSLAEQRRIADVLDAGDRAIAARQAERDALARQQRGLMQRLLTGRVRLPASP